VGREEGQKDQPSAIVLAVEREADGATVVFPPPRFFDQVLDAYAGWYRCGRHRLTPRG
jgi:hypothetical protein